MHNTNNLIRTQIHRLAKQVLACVRLGHFAYKWLVCSMLVCLASCMYDMPHTNNVATTTENVQLYILSEGLFNLNNSALVMYDGKNKRIDKDFFRTQNQRGLGDTGNDMALYGSKLYVVVNVSSQIEVLDAVSGVSVAQIPLFNEQNTARQPRYITFYKNKAYVSCFDGNVARIDTTTLQVEALVKCGRNPEGLCVSNGKLYVSNSGGLDFPNYDSIVSVIDLETFTEIKKIQVGINPGKIMADTTGDVYLAARGNFDNIKYQFQQLNTVTDELEKTHTNIQALNFTIANNKAYIYNYDYNTQSCSVLVFDCITEQVIQNHFIADGTTLQTPYSIDVNPNNGDVYITEAYNYTLWGDVLCFNADGILKFRLNEVGLNPNKVVFTTIHAATNPNENEPTTLSPYINRVLEYMPAPGQFVNTSTSAYQAGFSAQQVLEKVNEKLVKKPSAGAFVTLGGWGGYITVGFDHTIANTENQYDFKIYGNAFAGSAEPGIVLVAVDANQNGLPDDQWYELAGSEYENQLAYKNYQLTYYKPANPTDSVLWTDNYGNSGKMARVNYNTQPYYPQWIEQNQYTLYGTRLPNNAVLNNQQWILNSYPWGYADNKPNNQQGAKFNIDWAVDNNGNKANLTGIDFVKIYTAVQQNCGWVGEISTEFCNIEDLGINN